MILQLPSTGISKATNPHHFMQFKCKNKYSNFSLLISFSNALRTTPWNEVFQDSHCKINSLIIPVRIVCISPKKFRGEVSATKRKEFRINEICNTNMIKIVQNFFFSPTLLSKFFSKIFSFRNLIKQLARTIKIPTCPQKTTEITKKGISSTGISGLNHLGLGLLQLQEHFRRDAG